MENETLVQNQGENISIEQMVQMLKVNREGLAKLQAEYAEKFFAFEKENEALSKSAQLLKDEGKGLEQFIKDKALVEFQHHETKIFAEGNVYVKTSKAVNIKSWVAVEAWCKAHDMFIIPPQPASIDKGEFMKFAKNAKAQLSGMVETEQIVAVSIKKKLTIQGGEIDE